MASQYDTLKSIFLSDPEKGKNFWLKWLVSETNTILAQFLVYPYDTVKRNMMKSGEVCAVV